MRKWRKHFPGFHDAELTALIQDSVNIYSIVRRICRTLHRIELVWSIRGLCRLLRTRVDWRCQSMMD